MKRSFDNITMDNFVLTVFHNVVSNCVHLYSDISASPLQWVQSKWNTVNDFHFSLHLIITDRATACLTRIYSTKVGKRAPLYKIEYST